LSSVRNKLIIQLTDFYDVDTSRLCRNKAMRAAAFSADGSVLAVAADTVITLWDPNNNVLVAVIGETPVVIFLNPSHPYFFITIIIIPLILNTL